jgi:hypothetical protein
LAKASRELISSPNAPSDHFSLRHLTMSHRTNSDNIYPEGIIITAHVHPTRKLQIKKYYQRIYYCAVLGDEAKKHLVYFERELIPPMKQG